MKEPYYLTRREAALYLSAAGYPTSKKTLATFATMGTGPEYCRYGREALYEPRELLIWAEGRRGTPSAASWREPG